MIKVRDTAEVAKEIRANLKKAFPTKAGYKFRVRISRFSLGSSISVSIMSAPFYPFLYAVAEDAFRTKEYAQVNEYHIVEQNDGTFLSNAIAYTPQGARFLQKVSDIVKFPRWSDIEVGQWDTPFTVKAV